MKLEGKKIGKHTVTTPLHTYELDVRLVVRTNNFVIYAPDGRCFSNSALAVCKSEVEQYLRESDVTTYVDVIEYDLTSQLGYMDLGNPSSVGDLAGLAFRAVRVSTALDRSGRPRLEKSVEIDSDGKVVECLSHEGIPYRPSPHRGTFGHSISFTPERYRQCLAIKNVIAGFKAFLETTFGDYEKAAEQLESAIVPVLGMSQPCRDVGEVLVALRDHGDCLNCGGYGGTGHPCSACGGSGRVEDQVKQLLQEQKELIAELNRLRAEAEARQGEAVDRYGKRSET
jgi:hypothetical protein